MKKFIIIMACFLLYLFFIAPNMNAPLTPDEFCWPYAAQTFMSTGKAVDFLGWPAYWSPPVYLNIQIFLYKLLGISNLSSRLMGVFSIFIQLILLSLFSSVLFKEQKDRLKFALLSSVLFITTPAVIQGSLLPYEDTTFFPALFTAFLLLFVRLKGETSLKNIVILAPVFAICFALKLTTPLVLILSMLAYYLFNKDWKGVAQAALVAVFGIIIFIIWWAWYAGSSGLDMKGPIYYGLSSFLTKGAIDAGSSPFLGFATIIARLALWVGPYLFILALIALATRSLGFVKRKMAEPADILVIYAILLGIGYLAVGGMSFGFPKYHYPVFPVMAILSALIFKDIWNRTGAKDVIIYALLALAAGAYFYFFIGDPIYFINFTLREALALHGGIKSAVLPVIYKPALYLLPVLFVYLAVNVCKKHFRFSEKALVSLAIMALASNISLDMTQRNAPYLTRYCYGEAGTEEAVQYVGKNLSRGDTVLAPSDMVYYLRSAGKDVPYAKESAWYDLENIMNSIKNPSVRFVVYSVGHNDIRQFKNVITNPEFMSELKTNFKLQKIGTYDIWERIPRK